MKRRLKELAILLGVLGLLGLIVLLSGIVPIKASSGHWPITKWTLDFASDRSVGFHSSDVEVPPLNEQGMVQLGAATFDNNCRWCHGAPGFSQPPVAAQMTPQPPALWLVVNQWDDAELFYIIKNGIKFAGMPAWPTQKRDTEIWPVVAFLRELPEMEREQYLDLIQDNTDMSDTDETTAALQIVKRCAACHGMTGNSPTSDRVPVLAAQNKSYLKNSLTAYQTGERYSGVMMPIAHRLTDNQISQLVDYYSSQPRTASQGTHSIDESLIEIGRQLANQGDQSAKIPSCVDCHGPGEMKRSDEYPLLSGQSASYLQKELELFAQKNRGGGHNASIMNQIANKLNDSQRRALSAYYASINIDSEQ